MQSKVVTGAVLLFVLGGVACSKQASTATPPTITPTATSTEIPETANVDSGSSTLRATLTALLQEHVYLAGIAVSSGVGAGITSPAAKAALSALDTNSVALSRAIDGIYPGSAATFVALWRRHIGFFWDYTSASGKGPKASKAKADLDRYRQDFGLFLAAANPNLTKGGVANDLGPHVKTMLAVIDAALAKSPTVFAKLRSSAGHMPKTAHLLAGASAKQFPSKFDGSESSGASALRADLTASLQEHVYLTGIAMNSVAVTGLTSAPTKAALAVVDANSVALSLQIDKAVAGSGAPFLSAWRRIVGAFRDYAGVRGKGPKAIKAKADLERAHGEIGELLASVDPDLTKQEVADGFGSQARALLAVIDSALARSPAMFSKLRAAAGNAPTIAEMLSASFVGRSPSKYA